MCGCVWVCVGVVLCVGVVGVVVGSSLRRTPLQTPLRRTTLRQTAQFFALFSLPPLFSFFYSLSLGVFSLNFGGVFEGREPQMCTFGLSGCRVIPWRLVKWWREREKKREILGTPSFRAPPFGARFFLGLGPTQIGLAQNGLAKKGWAKLVLAFFFERSRTIKRKQSTSVNYHLLQNDYRYRSEIKSKTIGL